MTLYQDRVGVDEAGRGPVIGPMVIATIHIPADDDWLHTSGVADSKTLSSRKRERLADELCDRYADRALILSANQIDEVVKQPGDSLTKFEIRQMKQLLKDQSANHVVIDAPTKQNPFQQDNVIYEHKADETYGCVGAASIIAKVVRDNAVQRIKHWCRAEVGSGYPSDPATQAYLDSADFNKPWIRSQWQTIQDRKHENAQQTLRKHDAQNR